MIAAAASNPDLEPSRFCRPIIGRQDQPPTEYFAAIRFMWANQVNCASKIASAEWWRTIGENKRCSIRD